MCASRCGAPQDGWRKNIDDVPLPNDGFYWSISHKRQWAAAVMAREPVGIDIERIIPRRIELWDESASPEEWDLMGDRSWPAFFRIWTAKEATLKANGRGIGELHNCRVVEVPDPLHMTLAFEGAFFRVEHYFLEDHVAAAAFRGDDVYWHVIAQPTEEFAPQAAKERNPAFIPQRVVGGLLPV